MIIFFLSSKEEDFFHFEISKSYRFVFFSKKSSKNIPMSDTPSSEPTTYVDQSVRVVYNAIDIISATLLGPMDLTTGERTPDLLNQLALAVVFIVILLILYSFIKYIFSRIKSVTEGSPYIVREMKDASQTLMIPQDPSIPNSIPLRRSLNENGGIEFSYLSWLYVADYSYKFDSPKHIFHKGNFNGKFGSMTPGLFLKEKENALVLYMSTYENPAVSTEIPNIPVGKWFHVAITVSEYEVDVYINGLLKKRLTLLSLPKQNFGPLVLNDNGGFKGYISRFRYHDYKVSNAELEAALSYGPSTTLPSGDMQQPPYLSSNWWL